MRLTVTILTMAAAGLMGCHGQLSIGGSDGVGTGADEPGDDSGPGVTDGGSVPDTGWLVPDASGSTVSDTGIPVPTTGSDTPFTGAPGTSLVSALDDTQTNALCDWLTSEFLFGSPGATVPSDPTQGIPSGYATGPGIGCGPNGADRSAALGWTLLEGQYCVANLRQGPCQGSVSALVQCAHYIASEHNLATNPSGSCDDIASMCDPFTSAVSCTGTVFWPQSTAGSTNACLGSLPVVSNAPGCDAGQ
jgi:hypothetical protein